MTKSLSPISPLTEYDWSNAGRNGSGGVGTAGLAAAAAAAAAGGDDDDSESSSDCARRVVVTDADDLVAGNPDTEEKAPAHRATERRSAP